MTGNIPGFLGGNCEVNGCDMEARYHLFGHDFCACCYAKYMASQQYYSMTSGALNNSVQPQSDQLSLF